MQSLIQKLKIISVSFILACFLVTSTFVNDALAENTNQPIVVTVRFSTQLNRIEAFQQVMSALILETQKQPGCLHYSLYQSSTEPNEFLLFETWLSRASLRQHQNSAYFKEALSRFPTVLAKPFDGSTWINSQ